MKIFIQKNRNSEWLDITKYQNGIIGITETADGTYDKVNIQLITPSRIDFLDTSIPIPPHYYLKLLEDDVSVQIEGVNTFYFRTSDNNTARRRKAVEDKYDALYVHEISGVDITSDLDDTYLPNYKITQPKTEFYSTYNKSAGVNFALKQRASQDGSDIILNEGISNALADMNNDNNITYGYDELLQEHYIEFNELDKVGLNINFDLSFAKSAITKAQFRWNLVNVTKEVRVSNQEGGDYGKGVSTFGIEITSYYFEDNFSYSDHKEVYKRSVNYNGGLVKATGRRHASGNVVIATINELGSVLSQEETITLPVNKTYKKARVYYKIGEALKEKMIDISFVPIQVNSDILGYDNDDLVKIFFDSLTIKATTSAYDYELEEKKLTLLEFVEKAIFDYNLNNRYKVFLNEDLKVLLNQPAKESEWGDYTLREALVRAFKYVGIKPILKYNGEISYKKTNKVARYIDLEQVSNRQAEHLAESYYDKVVSNAKNLVSQEDFVLEILPVLSTNSEFSRMTEENAGFQTSNDIYFISNAVLYAPNISFTFTNGEVINTNIDKPYYWDITERLFENDIYESFPNVQVFDTVDGEEISIKTRKDLLTQGNTISYKSGDNKVENLFNIPEFIPNYRLFDSVLGTESGYTPEYAVIEMLIVLAFQNLNDPFGANLSNPPNIKFKDTMDFMLELTYVPIFNELTTKYVSNMPDRKGLNIEKKMNTTNKTISYQENESVLRKEMELKGNVKTLYSDIYKKVSDVIPYNSVVNDNIYITSRVMAISKNVVEVDYILQENFIIQNDDIGLPINFERYNVPYDFVKRELMLENHLIFSKNLIFKYSNEPRGSTIQFLLNTMFSKGREETIKGTLYSLLRLDGRLFIMRMAKLETRFTLLLSGMFSDNYNAGNQRYENTGDELYYTTPYRYTDGHGRVEVLDKLVIGYANTNDIKRIQRVNGRDYDLQLYPAGEYDGYEVELNIPLINKSGNLLLYKDGGEQIAITHTSYLENETEELKFYSFKQINKIGVLLNDIYLNDDLTIQDIDYTDTTQEFEFEINEVVVNTYQVNVKGLNTEKYETGIVFINEERGNETLVGIIKLPSIEDDDIMFYINNTQYGFYDDIEYVETLELEIENINTYNVYSDVDKMFSISFTDLMNVNKYDDNVELEKAPNLFFDNIINVNSYSVNVNKDKMFSISFTNLTNVNSYSVNVNKNVSPSLVYVLNNNNLYEVGVNMTTPNLTYSIANTNYYSLLVGTEKETPQPQYWNVQFVRAWNGTTIKNQSVVNGGNATFPTESQINYGAGYEYNFYTGTYTNVTSNRTITIYRKSTSSQQATWQYNGSSSQPICFSQPEKWIGTPCSNVGETMVINGTNEGYGDSCIELICKL